MTAFPNSAHWSAILSSIGRSGDSYGLYNSTGFLPCSGTNGNSTRHPVPALSYAAKMIGVHP